MSVLQWDRAGERPQRILIPLALGGALLATAGAAALSVDPRLLAALAGLLVVSALVITSFAEPRWVLVFQIAFVLAYAPNILAERFGVPVSPQTLTLLVLVAMGVRRMLEVERLRLGGDAAWLAGLLGAMTLSVVTAADRGQAGARMLEIAEIVILTLLLLMLLDRPGWLRRAVWAFSLAGGFLGGLALFQQVTGTSSDFLGFARIVEGDRELQRSAGPIDPNFLAQFLVATSAFALYLGLGARRRAPALLAYSIALVSVGAIFYTYSRGALLALAVALGVAGVLHRVRPWIPAVGLIALFASAALFLPVEAKERLVEVVKPGSSGLAYANDASVANRFAENSAAFAMFADRPLLGVGPANYSVRYHDYAMQIGLDTRAEERPGVDQAAHNLYLEALAEIGFIGAAVFFVVIARAVAGGLRLRRRATGPDHLLGEGIVVGLVGFFACSMFLHSAYPQYLWIVLALGLAAGRVAPDRSPGIA